MKKIICSFLVLSLILFSCKKDDPVAELRYDGDNFNAPALPAGTFDAGVRFPKNIIDSYIGRQLVEVEYYILNAPVKCEILIYGDGTASEPGNLLYSKDVTSEMSGNSWNSHALSTPVDIADEDIWICVRVVHNSEIRSIGCDEGPARQNGDWMLGTGETEWKTYRELSNDAVSINWNIRGYLNAL